MGEKYGKGGHAQDSRRGTANTDKRVGAGLRIEEIKYVSREQIGVRRVALAIVSSFFPLPLSKCEIEGSPQKSANQ